MEKKTFFLLAIFFSLLLAPSRSGTCETAQTDAGCATCSDSDNTTCLTCTSVTDYVYLNKSGCDICSDVITDCSACQTTSGATTCNTCGNSKFVTSTNSCDTCSNIIANCETCVAGTATTTCGACVSNKYFNSAKTACVDCSTAIASCSNCTTVNGTTQCNECAAKFVVNANTKLCDACPLNCSVCSSASVCTTCQDGYDLSNGTCSISSYLNISNCKYPALDSSGNAICTQCSAGYGMMTGDQSKCVLCSASSCDVCTLDADYNPSCANCSSGYAAVSGKCQTCSSTLQNCASCSSSTSCSTCQSGYFVKNATCKACSSTTDGGIANCQTCSWSSGTTPTLSCSACASGYYLNEGVCTQCGAGCSECNAEGCTNCLSGFYLDSSACTACTDTSCDTCPGDVCSKCKTAFFLSNSTCTACTSPCAECNTLATNCTKCISGRLLSGSSCSANCSSSCDTCSTATTCDSCSSAAKTVVGVTGNTCASSCASDSSQVAVSANSSCVSCAVLYSNCATCNSSMCLTCPSTGASYILADASGCTYCNQTGDVVDNSSNTTSKCNRQPNATIASVALSGFVPNISIACGVRSAVYMAFGLSSSNVLNTALSTIKTATGTKQNKIVAATDTVTTWIGYAAIQEVTSATIFQLSTILKNAGQDYSVIAYCESYSGSLSSSVTKTWTQPSNGGQTNIVNVTSSVQLNSSQKVTVGQAIKKVLKIQRQMYTDDGTLVQSNEASRLLQTTSYSVSFYFVPDYTLTSDNINSVITEGLSNTTTFLANVNTELGNATSFNLTNISTIAAYAQVVPAFTDSSPDYTVTTSTISFQVLISNTDGYVYAGLGKSIANSNTSDNTANLTTPSWIQFMNSIDVTGTLFVSNYTSYQAAKNQSVTVSFQGLNPSTSYNVYIAASTADYPRLNSSIYAFSATTEKSTYENKMMVNLIVLCVIVMMVLLG